MCTYIKDNIEYLYYLSSILGFIASFVMLFVAITQLKKIRLQQNFSSLKAIYDEMDQLRAFWNKVYQQFADNPNCMTWTSEEKNNADIVCMGLERIAFLAEKKFIDDSILLDEYAGVFAKTWYCLENYVKQERIRRKGPVELKANARFRKHYEKLAIKAQKFYDKNGYDYKIDKQLAFKNQPLDEKKPTYWHSNCAFGPEEMSLCNSRKQPLQSSL